MALHDEPQGRRNFVSLHVALLLRRRGSARPHVPDPARLPVEHVPPARRIQPGRDDPRPPDAPVGPHSPRGGVRELLRADSDRRPRHGVPPPECAELLGLPLQRPARLVELLRRRRDRGLAMDDVRPAQYGRVQPAGGRLDDGARAHVAHGIEHRLDRQLPRHNLPPSRSWDVSHAVAPVHLGLDLHEPPDALGVPVVRVGAQPSDRGPRLRDGLLHLSPGRLPPVGPYVLVLRPPGGVRPPIARLRNRGRPVLDVHSSVALDTAFRGTFWVVGHFHYTIVGGGLTGLFAGLYYWFPKMTGRMYDERLGKIHFAIYMIGFNLLYFPMHLLYDMPRRIFTYDASTGWGSLNLLITIGGFTFGISQLIMFANLLWSARRGPQASQDPWGGYSLEWGVPSPPPEFNFPEGVPVVSATGVTYRPVAAANGGHAMANGGHAYAGHGAESSEEHLSRWPIVTAAGAGIALWGVLMGLPALILGTAILAVSFVGWGYESLRGRETIEAVGEKWPFDRLENLSLGMWLFIFGEIAFFGTLFGAYVFLRMNSPLSGFAWPQPGSVHNIFWGGFNTIILLTSGLTMVFALMFARQGSYRGLQGSLVATFALGAFFIVNKAFEWRDLFASGFTFSTNPASSIYYVLTGVHGAHVVAGLTALTYLMVKALKARSTTEAGASVEIFGIYWGMVDAVWVFLVPLLYLL